MPNTCAQPTGACCDAATGACTIATQAACTFTWLGVGVACNTVTCPVPPVPSMILIGAGTFTMGSPTSEPTRQGNETEHQVTLTTAIYVSNYEVTQSEWQAVMGWVDSPNACCSAVRGYFHPSLTVFNNHGLRVFRTAP